MHDSASGAFFHAQSSNVISLDRYRREPIELGGPAWRRARGLLTLADLAADYRATHYIRHPGLLAALPCDLREVRP